MKFCPARRTITIFTEPRISAEDHAMKVLPIQPWGSTPAPPVPSKKPPVSRKPEGPWPRARVTPMPPLKGVVNQGYQSGGNSPHSSPKREDVEGMRRKREAVVRVEEERKMEEAKRKKEDVGRGCDCAAEEEAKLLRLHNVRLRQVASALASKLRASEAALGASKADADARLAALVRALLAFEAGLRREQSRIRSTMERLEGVVRAQKAEIALLKAAGAASGLRWEESSRRKSVELDWGAGASRGIRPASILRDVLRSQLGAAWSKREEKMGVGDEGIPAKGERKRAPEDEEGKRVPAEGEGKRVPEAGEGNKVPAEEGKRVPEDGEGKRVPAEGEEGTKSPEKQEIVDEKSKEGAERVKPPLPPRPRPRLTIPITDSQAASEVFSRTAEDSRFRDQWSAMEDGRAGGGWGLNVHFEEFVLEEATSEQSEGQTTEMHEQPPSTPPPAFTPPPLLPDRGQFNPSTPPPVPATKPRTALLKPPRKHPPVNKHQATVVCPPPLQFLLPDLLCPTPRGPEGVKESSGTLNAAYLKENTLNGDLATTPRGHSKGRPLAPSALQNAITPKGSEAAVEPAKGHYSYERFLEVTGLSQKSILSFNPPPPGSSRPLPPPPPKHRSVLKPRDVKMRSRAARNVGWEDGSGEAGVVASESATRRYWSGPFL